MVIVPTEKRFERERPPFVLFFLVLLNILVFALYQSNDEGKFQSALVAYDQLGYLEYEWPIFEGYLAADAEPDSELLNDYRALYEQREHVELSYYVLSDSEFFAYLRANRMTIPASEDFGYWDNRERIDDQIQSISHLALGVKPNDLNPLTLITHQFLHGGLMHLAGNLFFLVICGFAVEAAIGHLRFLLFYLLTGIAGGLLFTVINLGSPTPLVGASGAISGVMAMYLGIFRLKKIEFFYWLFIFVGYFRAPALVILPFYIGKELYSYFVEVDSNVAFMAHIGGFVAGAALILAALLLKTNIFDEEYIEDDQQAPPIQHDLAKIYGYIEKYNFEAALKAIDQAVASYGPRFEFSLLRYGLLRVEGGDAYRNCVMELLSEERLKPAQLQKVDEIWHDNPELQPQLDDDRLLKLGWRLAALPDISTAEAIFAQLYEQENRSRSLGNFARKLATVHDGLGNGRKKMQYAKVADQLSQV